MKLLLLSLTFIFLTLILFSQEAKKAKPTRDKNADVVKCGKIVYSKSISSVCFSDHFLSEISSNTSIKTDPFFNPTKLESDDIFNYPFCVVSGEDSFTLTEKEKTNLKKYLDNGGFILASPGCSNEKWNQSF
jgi:hypothetical protein